MNRSLYASFSAEQFPSELIRSMRLVAMILDRSACIRYANEHLLELTGWTLPQILGKSWIDVFTPTQQSAISELFADLINGRPEAWHHENPILTKSGEVRHIRWHNMVMRDEHGVSIGTASIGEDITEQRQLERSILDAFAREQQRASQQIHDGLGQDLCGVALLAKSIASTAARDAPQIAAELSQLSGLTNSMIKTCQGIAHGLSPLGRLEGGLVEALRTITTMPYGWQGPAVRFEVIQEAPMTVPLTTLEHVYRIAQEALANAIEHSRAKIITVMLQINAKSLRLEIEDDGIGSTGRTAAPGRIGLKAMEYRAHLIHASFSRRAVKPHGTVIRCELSQLGAQISNLPRRTRLKP